LRRAELVPTGARAGVYGLCLAFLACASSEADRAVAALAESHAGQAGGRSELHVNAQLLADVQRALSVPKDEALQLAAEDALLAAQLVDREPERARWIERTVLARSLLTQLGEEAAGQGPVTAAEIAEAREQRWWQLDRPRMVQVVHAVVVSAEENAAARAVAERILKQVTTASTPEEFQTVAAGVSADGFEVKVERLPPVALDGRAIDPERPPPAGPDVVMFDREFAAAAQRLEREGQLSPVVRSPFGYHVLRLIKVIEPQHPVLSVLQNLLHRDIMQQRASVLQNRLLDQLRVELAPERERSALMVMEQLRAPQ
jgi:hypothetical protein